MKNPLVVVVVLAAMFVVALAIWIYDYETTPVEVRAGVIVVCGDSHHDKSRQEVARNIVTKKVPRWHSGGYEVIEQPIVCDACQAKINEEARQAQVEQERQERARILRDSLFVRISLYPGWPIEHRGEEIVLAASESPESSVRPGDRTGMCIAVAWTGDNDSEPMDCGRLRLYSEPADLLTLMYVGTAERSLAKWKGVAGPNGCPIGTLAPGGNIYREPEIWCWPKAGDSCWIGIHEDAKPGTDIRVYATLTKDGVTIRSNTGIIHVIY